MGYAIASVSRIGPLIYAQEAYEETQFVIVDRTGHEIRKLGTPALYGGFRVSRDGARIAAVRADPANGASDLWIGDIKRGTFTRLTNTPWNEVSPVWSADGAQVIFASDRNGLYDLYQRMADGAGEDVELFRSGADKTPMAISPDGKNLVYQTDESGTGSMLWRLALSGEKAPKKLEGVRGDMVVSPDGKWAAYSSSESGRDEIYITPFMNTQGRTLVSSQGGLSPRWSSDGKRLFYISSDGQLMEAVVERGNKPEVGITKSLFTTKGNFDVIGEGKYFIFLLKVSTEAPHAVSVMLNWDSGMKKQ